MFSGQLFTLIYDIKKGPFSVFHVFWGVENNQKSVSGGRHRKTNFYRTFGIIKNIRKKILIQLLA